MESPIHRFILLAGILLLSRPLAGEEINLKGVDWLNGVSPPQSGASARTRPVRLNYHLTWKRRIKAAAMEIVINHAPNDPAVIHGIAQGKSTGLAGRLFPYRFTSRSSLQSRSLQPVSFEIKEEMRGKKSEHHLLFTERKIVCRKKSTNKKTSATKETTQNFNFEKNLSHDILSALLHVRNLSLHPNQEAMLMITAFDRPYLVGFTVLGREQRRLKGKKYSTIKLDLSVRRINDDLTVMGVSKLKKATVWLIDDPDRVPLELQVDLFVGHISAYLSKREFL